MTTNTEKTAESTKTVTGTYTLELDGTILTVLSADQKAELSRQLADDHKGQKLSNYSHEVIVEDVGREATVRVTAEAKA